MKKLNQHLLLAAAMLMAGSAYAQTPTNQFSRTPRAAVTPITPQSQTSQIIGAGPGTPAPNYSSYSQDSYVEQTNTSNYARVDQQDTRTGATRANNSGSTAVINQTGASNSAFQNQTVNESSNVSGGRNFMRSTQAGSNSQSSQTQTGGSYNVAVVEQGAGTSGNGAYQSQTGDGRDNSARITQANVNGYPAATNNRATQSQTGNAQTAVTEQGGANSYASQTQSGRVNDAYIGQGAPGTNNTAMQTQTGVFNNARIRQSVELPASSFNYADQRQTGYGDQADINQHNSNNFARQDQSGSGSNAGFNYPNNTSVITQGTANGAASTVNSAAYTVQSGTLNTAIINQK